MEEFFKLDSEKEIQLINTSNNEEIGSNESFPVLPYQQLVEVKEVSKEGWITVPSDENDCIIHR